MSAVRSVLEVPGHECFGLWPVSDAEPRTFHSARVGDALARTLALPPRD
ncbi:hypothetical protein [Streptomyces eurocidicus]|uniref:Uncharacterized protein n=1 Tax=Streptomyces eurocidicus TaxID=66423 RepID=A0A7W8F1Z8_STREU|nr:hypothetical protein [Streptomyces eurocidicus]MBB5120213.1 hypothetical protein [Streptomyces eurocidicus]MBF6056102.1 hypothetical protein [Streptomyces eurocidicus]